MNPSSQGLLRRIGAALRFRCPRCCKGAVWRAPFRMNVVCPVCHLVYEREPGYFTGAMYASYFLGIFLTLPVWMWMLFAGAELVPILVVAFALVLALTPVSFHYSRVIWMHIDCYFNPKTFEE
jgi:uncharacterized protein (DUF983 family)